ncbi:MAG: chromosome segregation protein SMC [Lachnospiraceae bacterium]|nr:chromosome segregation protein SMC [Lachnospiraceae bacterium]
MYLKSIEVHGFKSFANKILFEFHDGITAIVGPNGSGKSNVADAVRWVLGEQSAKQLRGNNMQDVIFSGTELRKPQGFAYVAITLDNSDHKLPVDYEEVTVARRVYRSGESEYLLNGSACRLRDIQEMFLDTGIGKEGYSIIGQGQIDRIVSGKPEERRELLDEAAGIVKFKKRKAVAEKNLAEEQLNLSRVTDIISEIEKQLVPLEKQSAVAKQYLGFKEELKKVEVNQFLLEQERNEVLKAELDTKQKIVTGDLEETKQNYENIRAEYERLETELEAAAQRLEQAKEEKAALDVAYEKNEGEIRVLAGQLDSIAENSQHFEESLAGVQKNQQKKQQELDGYLQEKQAIDEKLDAMDEVQAGTAEEMAALRRQMNELKQEIEQCNSDIFRILNENTDRKANIERYETMKEQSTIKKAELNKRALQNKSLEAEAAQAAEQCKEKLKAAANEVFAKDQTIQVLERKAGEESKELEKINHELEEKQRQFMMDSSKLDSLKNLTERYEGYGGSIRRVMEQKEQHPGIHGVVADLIKVDKNYETAIEIALGGSIQNVVTDNEATAKALIEYLKKNKAGRATFLPLTSISPARNNNESALREAGVIGLASTLVKADKQYYGLIQFLLGRIFVVDTIDHALALAKKYSYSLRIVTLEGEQLNPGGSLSGGTYKNTSNLLSRRREIEDLEKALETRKQELATLQAKKEELRAHRTVLREKAEAAKEELRELYVLQNTAKLNLNQAEAEVERIRAAFGEFANELQELEGQVTSLSGNIDGLRAAYEENVEAAKQKEVRIDECNTLLAAKQQEEAKLQEAGARLKVEFSGLEQTGQFALENIRRVKAELEQFCEEERRLRENAKNYQEASAAKEADIRQRKQESAENRSRTTALEELIGRESADREEKTRVHKTFFARREELSGRISALDKDAFRIQNQLEKLEETIDAQLNYMWEEYELTPSTAAELKDETFDNPAQNKKSISDLKGKIKALGDVNVNAIEDYRQMSERYEFLTTQREDLYTSEQTLLNIIAELDEEMRKQFAEKFAEISAQFNSVFKELFGGGKATLELQEEEDLLEAGIRIVAQPPGKKLQNMMQLSGGEKALTAISLLFAIQNLKPSPFCLLDEIEAALDDSNVKRYAQYLHKLTRDTQFIVITHRRGTMAAADILYGITMQEKGVSTLVSVNLIEDDLDK